MSSKNTVYLCEIIAREFKLNSRSIPIVLGLVPSCSCPQGKIDEQNRHIRHAHTQTHIHVLEIRFLICWLPSGQAGFTVLSD